MNSLKEMIKNNLTNSPELKEYNDVILNFISSYKQGRPDMSIEGCKSLIEGISKLISFNLDDGSQNLNNWNKFNFSVKFEKAVKALNLDNYEEEFVEKNIDLVTKLGHIRNERGDISHGQKYPKEIYSKEDFLKFITLWTEGLCYFLLSRYVVQKHVEEEKVYTEEQVEKFNNYLDGLYPEMKISYGEALREQDPFQYELEIEDYYAKNKEEENE